MPVTSASDVRLLTAVVKELTELEMPHSSQSCEYKTGAKAVILRGSWGIAFFRVRHALCSIDSCAVRRTRMCICVGGLMCFAVGAEAGLNPAAWRGRGERGSEGRSIGAIKACFFPQSASRTLGGGSGGSGTLLWRGRRRRLERFPRRNLRFGVQGRCQHHGNNINKAHHRVSQIHATGVGSIRLVEKIERSRSTEKRGARALTVGDGVAGIPSSCSSTAIPATGGESQDTASESWGKHVRAEAARSLFCRHFSAPLHSAKKHRARTWRLVRLLGQLHDAKLPWLARPHCRALSHE